MQLVNRIIAPVDFSSSSLAAASYAGALAARAGAHLTLLHLVEPVSFAYSMVGPSEETLRDLRQSRMTHACKLLEGIESAGAAINRELAEGDAATGILNRVQSSQRDLIVLSTRGAGTFQRAIGVGSVTLNVLAGAPCPVLSGTDFTNPPSIEGGAMICALDLGDTAERTLRWAARAACELGARLTVVHALTVAEKKRFALLDDQSYDALKRRVMRHFRELVEAAGVQAEIALGDGAPHEVVAAAARSAQAGWVVIGRSASREVMDRLRAHSYDIIRRSPCPVMSV